MADNSKIIRRSGFLIRKKRRKILSSKHPKKSLDVNILKDKLLQEFKSNINPIEFGHGYQTNSMYEDKFKAYMSEGFDNKIFEFINHIIKEKSIPSNLRINPLHKLLIETCKTLLMNHLEIVYLSLYLDKLGWITEGFSFEDNLLITAFAVKMYLNEDYHFILEELIRRRHNMISLINDWLKHKKDFNMMSIPPRDLNKKFNSLSKPANKYCKTDFIDHNNIVDYILQTSISYNESSKNKPIIPAHEKKNNNPFGLLAGNLYNQPFVNKLPSMSKDSYDNNSFIYSQNPVFVGPIKPEFSNIYRFPLRIPVDQNQINNNVFQENMKVNNKFINEKNDPTLKTKKKKAINLVSNHDKINFYTKNDEDLRMKIEKEQNLKNKHILETNIKDDIDKFNIYLSRELNNSGNHITKKKEI